MSIVTHIPFAVLAAEDSRIIATYMDVIEQRMSEGGNGH